MSFFSKIFFIAIISIIWVTLLFLTFSTQEYSNVNIKYSLPKLGKTEITNNGTIIIQDNINIINRLFSINNNYSITKENNNNVINVWTWIYLFQFNKIWETYTVKWEWFELKNIQTWIFFINSLNKKKIISSLNNKINLQLLHPNINEKIPNIVLYPHSYIIFDPTKNKNLWSKSDIFKISQVFNFNYFNTPLFINNKIIKNIIKYLSLNKEENSYIIENMFSIIYNDYNKLKNNFLPYKSSTIKSFLEELYIEKYYELFINNDKKKIYYKNIILKKLKNLSNLETKDKKIFLEIIELMNKFKNIDKENYNEMYKIINFYYRNILLTEKQNINKKINYFNLISNLDNNNFSLKTYSWLELNDIYYNYDFLSRDNFYAKINNYLIKSINENKEIEIDYLLFFLEKILTSDFSSISNLKSDINNLIIIFDKYVKISNKFYTNSTDSTKITWLYINSNILIRLTSIIRENFFNEERNKKSLLIKKNHNSIDNTNFNNFKYNIEILLNYYKNNENLLDSNKKNTDKVLISNYSIIWSNIKEYFLALLNYEDYKIKYDISKESLLKTNTINEWISNYNLSISKANNYLKQFNGIIWNNHTVTLKKYNYCNNINKDDNKEGEYYCYKINNLNINWFLLSFKLSPFSGNKINNILVKKNWKINEFNWSYKLDEVKNEMNILIKNAINSKEKEKYNFSNFLLNNFWKNQTPINNNAIYENNNNNYTQEDPIVRIFKRNKLLWNLWDFASLNWYFNINYENIIVKNNDNWYNVYLSWWTINSNININNKRKIYNILFNSDYIFDSHEFLWINIKYINWKNKSWFLLNDNSINLIWNFHINNFKNEFNNFLLNSEWIFSIVNTIKNNLNITKYDSINYYKQSSNITFETKHNWKNILIKLNNWKITSFIYNNNELLKTSTNYSNLVNILKLINNEEIFENEE